MLLIFCRNLRKDQLYGKPGKYFVARGPVRLGVPRAPMQVKMVLPINTVVRRLELESDGVYLDARVLCTR